MRTRNDGDEIRRRLDESLERLLDYLYPGWQHRGGKAYLVPVSARDLGSFQVELRGSKRGLWHRFSQGVGGGTVELLSYYTSGKTDSYAQAFREARSFLGMSDGESQDNGTKRRRKQESIASRIAASRRENSSATNIPFAMALWREAIPLPGTIGHISLNIAGSRSISSVISRMCCAGTRGASV